MKLTTELDVLKAIGKFLPLNRYTVLGPSDDAAIMKIPQGKHLVVTTDMIMEGTHFVLSKKNLAAIGRKALAVNLSDLAAMAATPLAAFAAIAIPKHLSFKEVITIHKGMAPLAETFNVAIAGGDTNIWRGPLVICVTAIGANHKNGGVLRSGAKIGDYILVTGSLGGSIFGKHLKFVPRIREAQYLRTQYNIHSMIDLSDGVGIDLWRICQASHCGAIIWESQIPVSNIVKKHFAKAQRLKHALSDGEDFELCFTAAKKEALRIAKDPLLAKCGVSILGEICQNRQMFIKDGFGRIRKLKSQGYLHHLA